jgi:phosphatidylserine decarboxylase
VHSPVNGQLEKMRYIPGELWPVNEPFVRFTPRLFVRNERLVFDIREEKSGGLVHVVMVGALNVGRISTPFWPGMFTNTKDARVKYLRTERQKSAAHHLLCGQEIGTFMLGSTVVIVWDKKVSEYYNLKNQTEKSKIQLGDALLD